MPFLILLTFLMEVAEAIICVGLNKKLNLFNNK